LFRFFKWIFNSRAPVRPGCFSQVCLVISASFALPGLAALLRGAVGASFWLLLSSLIPIVLFALPAWNAWRRSERLEQNTKAPIDSMSRETFTDEYTPLRDDLTASAQLETVEQLNLLLRKHEDFTSVLNSKFKETEVTYHRYLDSGSKVFEGAIKNRDLR